MAGVRDHTDLVVWQLCDELRKRVHVFELRRAFDRDVDLRRQLSRAAARLCPVIAEGFSRYHPRAFGAFVRIAKGSLTEITDHLSVARARGFITDNECAETCRLARRARGAATRLILYLESAEAPNVPRTRPRKKKK